MSFQWPDVHDQFFNMLHPARSYLRLGLLPLPPLLLPLLLLPLLPELLLLLLPEFLGLYVELFEGV
jgi:hypothetical protein